MTDAMNVPEDFNGPPVWMHQKRGGVLIAAEKHYKGSDFFEVRLWVNDGNTPTGKGITMPLEAVAGLAKALTAYAASLEPDYTGE